jgi:hypothetical protein
LRTVERNTLYRHYKGYLYYVKSEAIHTETNENMVVYHLYGEHELFVRSSDMFLSEVPEDAENPTGQKYRFMTKTELDDDPKSKCNLAYCWK